MRKPFVVAIDGPAGSGKSTVSKAVANSLGFGYCDTGAAYRTLAWACIEAKVDLDDENSILTVHSATTYGSSDNPEEQVFLVDGVDVSAAIREESVSRAVSKIARHPGVRKALIRSFRDLIKSSNRTGIVMEGRDITTVVAPDAEVRILLTADQGVRIARRQAEFQVKASEPIARGLVDRDQKDSEVVDFMVPADGVRLLDSGPLSFEQTVEATLSIIFDEVGDLSV